MTIWRVLVGAAIVILVGGALVARLSTHRQTLDMAKREAHVECSLVDPLFASHQSDAWTAISGSVVRLLPSVEGRFRHQRFIVRCGNGHTILVVNDIDIGRYVPVVDGAPITVRGQYVWNPQGGLLHFTHHDPQGGPGGWIFYRGRLFS